MNKMETMYDSRAYVRNHKFFDELRRLYSQDYITCDEMKKLRIQALSGDADGAVKELARMMYMRGYA